MEGIKVHGFDTHPDISLRIALYSQSHLDVSDASLLWEAYTDVITSPVTDVDHIQFTSILPEPFFIGHTVSRYFIIIHPIRDKDIGISVADTSWEPGAFGINHIEFLYTNK